MSTEVETTRYTHLPIGKDVEAFAGYYTPEKEVRLNFNKREVLYVTGHIVIETTCGSGSSCKPADYWYANVIGYVTRWQFEKNKEDLPVTEVELIRDTNTLEAIRGIVLKDEPISRVDFW
jgi:hypothetical protein